MQPSTILLPSEGRKLLNAEGLPTIEEPLVFLRRYPKSSRVWRTHNLALTGLPSSGARRHERNHGSKIESFLETSKSFATIFIFFANNFYLVGFLTL